MKTLIKIENLLQRKKIIFSVFFFLIICQLAFGFLFPTHDDTPYWKTIDEFGQEKNYSFSSFDDSIASKILPFLSDYRINSDDAGYMLLAHDFPLHYFRGHLANLNRPLYPISVFLLSRPFHLISDSYALTFAVGILLNCILLFFTVVFLYFLVEKIVSKRVALLSCFLLIFSPFVHIWLVQPETNIFGLFATMSSIYLLYDYLKHPSLRKLIIFSLAIGFLLLGKMLFIISIFVLLLAFWFRRYKEGAIFLIVHLIPKAFWYLWVSKIFGIAYFSSEVDFGYGTWLFNIFQTPWEETFRILMDTPSSFIFSLTYAFLLLPLIFAVIGFKNLSFEKKNVFCFSFVLSFLLFFLVMNYYTPRHAFLLFPIVYPLAVLGIDRIARFLKTYKNWYSLIFYILAFALLIIISNVDIFKIFRYDIGFPWLY